MYRAERNQKTNHAINFILYFSPALSRFLFSHLRHPFRVLSPLLCILSLSRFPSSTGRWLSLSRCATAREMWNQPTPITLTNFALGEVVVRHETGKRASEWARERTVEGQERFVYRRRERVLWRSTKWRVPPTSEPSTSRLVTTSGWYVELKPYVSSWLTSLSPFPPHASPLFLASSVSLALSSLHHRSTTRTPWLSSIRPLFTFFPSRPARLSRILFPWFTRPSRKRGEFARLSTVLFPILFPFLSFSHLCLFILSVHRFLSFSIAANAVKDGNVDKTTCCRRCLDNVIYMYAIVKEESRPFSKHYDEW